MLQEMIMRPPSQNAQFWRSVSALTFTEQEWFRWSVDEHGAAKGLEDLMLRVATERKFSNPSVQCALDLVATILVEYHHRHDSFDPSVSARNFLSDFMRFSFSLPHFWVAHCFKMGHHLGMPHFSVFYMHQQAGFFSECRRLLDAFGMCQFRVTSMHFDVDDVFTQTHLHQISFQFMGIFSNLSSLTIDRERSFDQQLTYDRVEQLVRFNFPHLIALEVTESRGRMAPLHAMGSPARLFRHLVQYKNDIKITLFRRFSTQLYIERARAMDTFIRADAEWCTELPAVVHSFFRHRNFEPMTLHLIDLFVHGRQVTKERFEFDTPAGKLSSIERF